MLKRRLIALLLCICMLGSMTVYATDGETEPALSCTCGTESEEHAVECDLYVAPETEPEATEEHIEIETESAVTEGIEVTLYDQMIAAVDTTAMYELVLDAMNNKPETLNALSADEIASLRVRIKELDPEIDDTDTEDLLDTLAVLPNGGEELEGEPEVLADLTANGNVTWSGNVTYSSGTTTWTFNNGATAYLQAPCTVKNGATLRIVGNGGIARFDSNKSALIVVESGGQLIIEGNSETERITVDGKDIIADAPLIISSGTVQCKYAVIQKGKNRSINKDTGKPNGQGGGITIGSTGSLTMEHCVITKNTASLNGGGIYSSGPVNIKNSEISYNRAMSSETGPSVVNAGRGAGFAFAGVASVSTFENVLITRNAAMYYGGGGQISGGASLTISGNTTISYNEALLHGAAGLHVTGDAKFTMNGGSIEYNTAQTVGGGIHSSYSCTLNLNSGSISNNTANGRGGGVHVNTGGAITLGAGLTISGNQANNQATGSYADVDATGDNWSNVKYQGAHQDNGYGGGVMIDSGTCTVEGATISGNHAAVGGGGIALTMLNMGDGGLDDLMVIGFTMTSGNISNNTTNGDGAGVYLMSNRAKEQLIATYGKEDSEKYLAAIKTISEDNRHIISGLYEDVDDILYGIPVASVSGGTIKNNIAANNGGGLYLGNNTKFTISGTGDISLNTAIDGAGVYVASGTAEIHGGTLSENKASGEGGAIYVSGTVDMQDGTIHKNEAVENGGAVYVTGGNFTMTSGKITYNKATGTGSNGGGVYAKGGSIVIGVQLCAGTDTNHTVDPTDKIHPVIQNNEAVDSGGGIALIGNGNITMYCGDVIDNDATNRGRGLNVYMENGEFHYYKAADVGKTTEPEVVIVGGKLIDYNYDTNNKVALEYHHCNDMTEFPGEHVESLANKTAEATNLTYINLPDGEKYWTAPDGYRFFGWTFYGPGATNAPDHVRDKDHYKPLGAPILVQDNDIVCHDGTVDGTIDMYALWAPETSSITYYGCVIDGVYDSELNWTNHSSNPEAYNFTVDSHIVTLKAPTLSGYDFKGWYIYQNLNQNANWGYEPVYKSDDNTSIGNLDFNSSDFTYLQADANGAYHLEMGDTLFGDITLIADFEPAFTNLTIYKTGWDSNNDINQSFIFKVEGRPYNDKLDDVELLVTIKGNGKVEIISLPVGEYTVTEINEWSWRYADHHALEIDLIDSSKTDYGVEFKNTRLNELWLSGENFFRNLFNGNVPNPAPDATPAVPADPQE